MSRHDATCSSLKGEVPHTFGRSVFEVTFVFVINSSSNGEYLCPIKPADDSQPNLLSYKQLYCNCCCCKPTAHTDKDFTSGKCSYLSFISSFNHVRLSIKTQIKHI